MQIINIGVHHLDGIYTLNQVNNSHRQRWPDFPSQLRPDLYVGYNFIIWKDGTWTQCRFVGEETAAQKGHNFDTASIALQGSFTTGKDKPTEAQVKTLKWMMKALTDSSPQDMKPFFDAGFAMATGTRLMITRERIYPHRILQPNHTECYGTSLTDKWAADLLLVPAAAPPVVAPAPAGPEQTVPLHILQAWQAILKMFEQIFGRPAFGGGRTCSQTDVRG